MGRMDSGQHSTKTVIAIQHLHLYRLNMGKNIGVMNVKEYSTNTANDNFLYLQWYHISFVESCSFLLFSFQFTIITVNKTFGSVAESHAQ